MSSILKQTTHTTKLRWIPAKKFKKNWKYNNTIVTKDAHADCIINKKRLKAINHELSSNIIFAVSHSC